MHFPTTLLKGILLKRYKRFLCDVKLENNLIVTAHCPNSGSMLGLTFPLSKVYLSKIDNNKAKLKYRLELIEINGTLVGVNTLKANGLVLEALQNKLIPEFINYSHIKPEATYKKNCRFDFMLTNPFTTLKEISFLEVKSVTLSRNTTLAEFPDAITTRGLKHLQNLIEVTQQGAKAYILYLIQREDCNSFTIAKDIDLNYYNHSKLAQQHGVKILGYSCKITLNHISLYQPVDINLL